ncbi:MAG: NAD(P)/FAD-dependent oxidoreductase [Planctomycetota bacterium]|jgi:uncharacterized FAD-dependent dehydrogenase
MIWRLHNLSLAPDHDPRELRSLAADRLGVTEEKILALRVRRRSLDARRRPRIRLVYLVDVTLPDDETAPREGAVAPPDPPDPFADAVFGTAATAGPVYVVGAGPAGLAAAWGLARLGYQPRVLERGRPVPDRVDDVRRFWEDRVLDPESNLLFGEGGAGAFSDGKLKTRIGDPLLWTFLNGLVEAGAPEAILTESSPHLGTDGVRAVAMGLRGLAEARGAVFAFEKKFEGLEMENGRVAGLRASGEVLAAGAVVLAVGGSARDTFEVLRAQGVAMEAKPFQMGLRIEHPQEVLDRMQYGPALDRYALPPAEYRFTVRLPAPLSPVFTFCMCPGGQVVPAVSEAGGLCTNGMSSSTRDGALGNAALVVTVVPEGPDRGPLWGVALQRKIEQDGFRAGGEDYGAPAQSVRSFLEGGGEGALPPTSFPFGVRAASLSALLPSGAAESIREGILRRAAAVPEFAEPPALLLGPETRGSSPVRILRDGITLDSPTHPGLYPAGEGAGYAGGIASAGVDGLRAALAVARRLAPPP